MANNPPKAFITYSHKDTVHRKTFEVHLAVMVRNQEIEIWTDAEILVGDQWDEVIKNKLDEADILIYLVSPHSLASQNCNKEFTNILDRDKKIPIVPIILDRGDFDNHKLSQFQATPTKNGSILPISEWPNESTAWQSVTDDIRRKIKRDLDAQSPRQEPSSEQDNEDINLLFDQANFFMLLGHFQAAIRAFNYILQIEPDNAAAYSGRGVTYINIGELDLAISDCSKAIELNPDSAGPYISRGLCYSVAGKYEAAIADCSKAIELNPDSAGPYTSRGLTYVAQGKPEFALADYNKVIELNPFRAQAYVSRGMIYQGQTNYDAALADFNKAINISPTFLDAYMSRALTYRLQTNYDAALTDYDRIIEADPFYLMAYMGRAEIKKSLKRFRAAKEDLRIAMSLAEEQGDQFQFSAAQELLKTL